MHEKCLDSVDCWFSYYCLSILTLVVGLCFFYFYSIIIDAIIINSMPIDSKVSYIGLYRCVLWMSYRSLRYHIRYRPYNISTEAANVSDILLRYTMLPIWCIWYCDFLNHKPSAITYSNILSLASCYMVPSASIGTKVIYIG